ERLLGDDQAVAADQHFALLREVERHDRDPLGVDVMPDVELGPVREREDAHALAGIEAAVEQPPQFRPLPLGVPLAEWIAQREHPLLGARALLVTARAAERRVESAGLQ